MLVKSSLKYDVESVKSGHRIKLLLALLIAQNYRAIYNLDMRATAGYCDPIDIGKEFLFSVTEIDQIDVIQPFGFQRFEKSAPGDIHL
jgi:hypothetical protein